MTLLVGCAGGFAGTAAATAAVAAAVAAVRPRKLRRLVLLIRFLLAIFRLPLTPAIGVPLGRPARLSVFAERNCAGHFPAIQRSRELEGDARPVCGQRTLEANRLSGDRPSEIAR